MQISQNEYGIRAECPRDIFDRSLSDAVCLTASAWLSVCSYGNSPWSNTQTWLKNIIHFSLKKKKEREREQVLCNRRVQNRKKLNEFIFFKSSNSTGLVVRVLASQPEGPEFDSQSQLRVKPKTFNIGSDCYFPKHEALEVSITGPSDTFNTLKVPCHGRPRHEKELSQLRRSVPYIG